MGRIIDLCGEVAAAADDGAEGLELPLTDRERLLGEWSEEDLDDALALVRDSLLQGELVDSADSLGARLFELLGRFGDEATFAELRGDGARLTAEEIGQLARRLDELEGVLELFRDEAPPDRTGFDALRGRLSDMGIEADVTAGDGDD